MEIGIVMKVTDQLTANGIEYALFTETTPNSTCTQVDAGIVILQKNYAILSSL
jgi:alcohol dehydrogenase class IV